MEEMIFEPCSINATVVPTGACEFTSAVFASATCAKRLPESTTTPKRLLVWLMALCMAMG